MCLHFIFFFLIFSLVLLNLKFILYNSLNQMSGSWLVSLILQEFHRLVNSFRLSCFYSDISSLLINTNQASYEFPLHFLTNTKVVSLKLIIRKSYALLLPLYICISYLSFLASSSVGTSYSFFKYFRVLLCLSVALVLSFH